jgi:hypothetical protein
VRVVFLAWVLLAAALLALGTFFQAGFQAGRSGRPTEASRSVRALSL